MANHMTPENVDRAASLLRCYRSLTWQLARAPCSGVSLSLADDDSRTTAAYVPPELTHAVLGAARGVILGQLYALGVDPDGTSETECLECGGSGKALK